jgi:alpha-L-rhamnosidase
MSHDFTVTGLKTEYLAVPMGIEVPDPQFSWSLAATGRNVRQAAYRIQAASVADKLDQADLWDSGRVESDRCFGVPYAGVALGSGQSVYWRVTAWDHAGNCASAESCFEMGLLKPTDWRGSWLVAEDPAETADRAAGINWVWADVPHDDRPVCLRYRFELPAAPKRAELLLSAKDRLRGVWVNGEAVAFEKFAWVYWGTMRRLPMTLQAGSNAVCIEVNALVEDFLPPDGGAVAVLLRIENADGSITRLTTGPDWRAIRHNGEGWQSLTFDDRAWPAVVPSKARMFCEPLPAYPARLLRRAFRVAKPVARARLYATALGVYEPFVNGAKVGAVRLAPEVSTATSHVYYQTYDVTTALRQGANALGFHVGDGWYAGALGWRNERYSLGDAPKRLLAQLVIDYADGTREIVATDGAWRSHVSPVQASDIYNGESHDARLELTGWSTPEFDDAAWDAAVAASTPNAKLVAQPGPFIQVKAEHDAVSVKEVKPDTFVYDFGQNFSGWTRMAVTGASGASVTLRYGEILLENGEVDQSNLRGADATDRYILKGDVNGECFEPVFTYHGFRFVQSDRKVDLKGIVAYSILPDTGAIKVQNAQIQQFCNNTLWSQRANFFGVPTDCPQRDERLGWMGDIQVYLDAASFAMDTDGFIRHFLNEVRASQSPEGAYPVVTPQPRSFPYMYTAGWSEAGVILPWTLFERYGDRRAIDDNWDAMCRWMDFLKNGNPDWLWRNDRGLDLGDWLSVDAIQPWDETTPRMLAATAYWAYCAELMAKMAQATGRSAEAQSFRIQHQAIVKAFRSEFVGPDGKVGNGSQTSYVLALKFGLVPEGLRPAAAAHLAAEIAGRGTTLSTGFLGTPYLLDVLCDNGQTETAVQLLLQSKYPSWGYMIAKDATTIWERWNADVGDISMNSYNHYALGAVVGFIWRRLAGIAPAEAGFRRIQAKPLYDPRIGAVEAAYDSCLGRIASRVEGDQDGLARFALTVPANAEAQVHLPRARNWREGGKPLQHHDSVRIVAEEQDTIVVAVGSGDYLFET